jgi:hypothetical protein
MAHRVASAAPLPHAGLYSIERGLVDDRREVTLDRLAVRHTLPIHVFMALVFTEHGPIRQDVFHGGGVPSAPGS